jgi:hypothetical protein
MDKKYIKYLKIAGFAFLLIWLGIFVTEKINLTTADLGRHIKNGEILLAGGPENNARQLLLTTNYYSYTYSDFPFVNHHWGSGVIFFLVWKVASFWGLSLFYLLTSLATFSVFFYMARKEIGFKISFVLALLLIPLIAERTEVRPEVFTYLFSGIFFLLLWEFIKNRISFWRVLMTLVILEIIWVNLHIGFVFGIFIIGAFLLQEVVKYFKTKDAFLAKNIFIILIATSLSALLNPHFIKGVVYPFEIFNNFGYRLAENQSVWFLQRFGMENPNFFLIKIIVLIMIVVFIVSFVKNRQNFSWAAFVVGLTFCFLGLTAMRNFTMFGLFMLPVLAINLKNIGFNKNNSRVKIDNEILGIIILFILFFSLALNCKQLSNNFQNFGFGLQNNVSASAEFFRAEEIKGPILNNYDIGGYLTFHLLPQEKVFVDNRPEAYPASFFQEEYIPLQEDDSIWQEQDEKNNFNAIFFYRHDLTNWGQEFLVSRVGDDNWEVVFVDDYSIIFLKNNDQNRGLIKKYKISKDRFKITRQ